MELSEYIKLDITYHTDRELVFENFIKYLSNISETEFRNRDTLKLKSYSSKFLEALNAKRYLGDEKKNSYMEIVDEFNNNLKRRNKSHTKPWIIKILSSNRSLMKLNFQLENNFETVLNEAVSLINESREFDYLHSQLDIGEFYEPKNSNKEKIKQLLFEAIDNLNNDITIKEKSKKKVIEFIKKAIDELDSDYTNWTTFLGRLKETIIVLGAIGSLAGGISVLKAKEKVEEATNVVYQTSITINHKSISQTFNINDAPTLQQFQQVLKLEEDNSLQVNHKGENKEASDEK
jgi:hypothetical protein